MDPLLVPRLYQRELLEHAIARNTIIRMDTGSGKTLVAILLIKHLASLPLKKGTLLKIVFLVPTVALVHQQAATIASQTALTVKALWGEMGIDYWEREKWVAYLESGDVIVCTPQIWLNALSNAYWSMEKTSLIVLDEAHHASKNHPYARIMKGEREAGPFAWRGRADPPKKVHYHPLKASKPSAALPKILGMTASPIYNAKSHQKAMKSIEDLEATLNARLVEVKLHAADLENVSKKPKERMIEFESPLEDGMDSPFENDLWKFFNEITLSDKMWMDLQQTKSRLGAAGRDLSLSSILARFLADSELLHFHPRVLSLSSTLSSFLTPSILLLSLSDQFRQLLNILTSYCTDDQDRNFHSIVFVQRREDARLIKELVELWTKEDKSRLWIKPGFLVGHGGVGGMDEREKLSEMGAKEQERVVAAFRTGEINLLFATQVAEEGLDFAACNVIIRYDPLQTITGYIQSRGRARASDSEFIVLAGRGSREADLVREYQRKEPELRELYGDRPTDEADEPELEGLETYTVASTGALLTHYAAVSLLSEFCALLPSGYMVTNQQPVYSEPDLISLGPFQASVTLPMIAALDGRRKFQGRRQPTKKAAKQSVAFLVCVALHKAGALNDHLLPIRIRHDDEALDIDGRKVQVGPLEPKLRISSPNVFGNVWLKGSKVSLSIIEIEDAGEVLEMGLICGAELELFEEGKLWDIEPDRELVVRRTRTTMLDWSEEERKSRSELLEKFNRDCFRVTINRRIDETRLLTLWAPLLSDSSDIDWKLLSNAFQPVDVAYLTPETTIVLPHRRPSKRIFSFVSVRTDVTTLSETAAIETEANHGRRKLGLRYQNYFIYTKVAYDYHDLDETTRETILELRSLPDHPQNHLALSALKSADVPYEPTIRNFPTSMCRIAILPLKFWGLIRKTPSLLRLIQNTIQVRLAIQHFHLPPIDVPLLVEALTPPAAACGFNYETLETVGDSVLKLCTTINVYLKYPLLEEGYLAGLRKNSIDNRFLRNRCRVSGMCTFILASSFKTLNWCSPTSDDSEVSLDGTQINHSWVNRKALADTMESVLGAAFLSGGIQMALTAGDKLGLCFGGDIMWDKRDWSVYNKGDEALDTPRQLASLEEKIGYHFKDPRILLQAVTHRSFRSATTYCYEREEFLGDAILDFWVTSLLVKLFPDSTPRKLTHLRALLVSGPTLSYLAIRHLSVPDYLLHNHPDFNRLFEVATEEAAQYDPAQILTELTWMWDPPKVLGDVVEAIVGAIFVDSGGKLEGCYQFLDSIYSETVKLMATDTERRDPRSRLLEFTQDVGCQELKVVGVPRAIQGQGDFEAQVIFHSEVLAAERTGSKFVSRQLACRQALIALDYPDKSKLLARCHCKKEAAARKKLEQEKMEIETAVDDATAVDELEHLELEEETLVDSERPFKKRKSEDRVKEGGLEEEDGELEDDEDDEPGVRVRVYY